jgi:hypothetical protein
VAESIDDTEERQKEKKTQRQNGREKERLTYVIA